MKITEKQFNKFVEKLKEASKENDWEYDHDDGFKDEGFIVISGEEFINKLTKELKSGEFK